MTRLEAILEQMQQPETTLAESVKLYAEAASLMDYCNGTLEKATLQLDEIDALYKEKMPIDEKTYQFICFALSIKGRSKPCVLKHFKGALEAGATVEELSYIFALTMREAAGADDCWTHDVIGDWREIVAGNVKCSCAE